MPHDLLSPHDRELDTLIRARYPILYVVSPEEARVEDALRRVVDGRMAVFAWSATEGFGNSLDDRAPLDGTGRALDGLSHILHRVQNVGTRAVWVLRDFDAYLDHPVVLRKLRDLAHALKRSHSTLVLLSPILHLPPHIEKEIVVLDYPLPQESELGELLDDIVARVSTQLNQPIEVSPSARDALIQAARGLSADEATNAFHKVLVQSGALREDDADAVLREKKQLIRKSRALEFYEAGARFDDIGGLESLKSWLDQRRGAWSERAREFGLPAPRGVLLLGVPGCGKSLTARAIGAHWHLPLLRFDVSSVFGKYVGESEANLRRALRAAEAVAPCVLWIDELEKAFASMRGDDGGTALRILGQFLSWLQENKSGVFVVATANGIAQLPPELLRRGRLDEIFFVDLPSQSERESIFAIHLRRRGRNPQNFDLGRLAALSHEYSGAEIEGAVVAGLYDAFDANRELQTDDIARNLEITVPLSRTMREEIARLRDWAKDRARLAS
jgi:hypothetical protein